MTINTAFHELQREKSLTTANIKIAFFIKNYSNDARKLDFVTLKTQTLK